MRIYAPGGSVDLSPGLILGFGGAKRSGALVVIWSSLVYKPDNVENDGSVASTMAISVPVHRLARKRFFDVATDHGWMVKLTALDMPPEQFPLTDPVDEEAVALTIATGRDGVGVRTVTFATAGDTRSAAGILAVNW